ncbi:hypothetical protein BATDEDRAFT_26445 [Batrachochytrium dendrobatidis JAM81]|uniref:Skg3/CAF120-like PH-like domain-containing protein n=1 Tax=Batrachochytrium dendrobatidis (strain JAM81 / FGSC 10211) TaxID=684364 RepID=F4P8F6_BATDJ|nr:uncharacterized protein BATDEDRAFT_26445 [Batrachochytrium dendrobatidis JAM81]EGF78427.1 hypothetical protein BATDEDRAFT_26445 [Batrachochytrium dendrobatidis JAM81]|eukprot:XP_006680670.1 hypothetical protein BATDEDRAFT_26445 [Batrachochytrium dendrobatidis JAM81]
MNSSIPSAVEPVIPSTAVKTTLNSTTSLEPFIAQTAVTLPQTVPLLTDVPLHSALKPSTTDPSLSLYGIRSFPSLAQSAQLEDMAIHNAAVAMVGLESESSSTTSFMITPVSTTVASPNLHSHALSESNTTGATSNLATHMLNKSQSGLADSTLEHDEILDSHQQKDVDSAVPITAEYIKNHIFNHGSKTPSNLSKHANDTSLDEPKEKESQLSLSLSSEHPKVLTIDANIETIIEQGEPVVIETASAITADSAKTPLNENNAIAVTVSTDTAGAPAYASIIDDLDQSHADKQPSNDELNQPQTLSNPDTADTKQLSQQHLSENKDHEDSGQVLRRSYNQFSGASDPLQLASMHFALSQKFYYCGFLYKKNELGADGRPILSTDANGQPTRGGEWSKCWMELWGPILQLWHVPDDLAEYAYSQGLGMKKFIAHEMDPAQEFLSAIKSTHTSPTYINVTDAITELFPNDFRLPDQTLVRPPPTPYTSLFALSNAGSNLILFSCISGIHCNEWIAAIRLVAFELHKLNQLFTYRLLKRPQHVLAWEAAGIAPFESQSFRGEVKYEGPLQIRTTYATRWKAYHVVVTSRVNFDSAPNVSTSALLTKKLFGKRSTTNLDFSKRGNVLFFESKADAKKGRRPAFILDSLQMVQALWPEKPELIEMGLVCIAKLVGTIHAPIGNVSRNISNTSMETEEQQKNMGGAGFGTASTFGGAPILSPQTFTNYTHGFPAVTSIHALHDIIDGLDPRPLPHHVLILAQSTDELAKWITSIYAAFSVDTDHIEADAEIQEMARTASISTPTGGQGNSASVSLTTTSATSDDPQSFIQSAASTADIHQIQWPTSLFLSTSEIAGILMCSPVPFNTHMQFSHYFSQKLSCSRNNRLRSWCESVAKGEWERSLAARHIVEAKLKILFKWVDKTLEVLKHRGIVLPDRETLDDGHASIGPKSIDKNDEAVSEQSKVDPKQKSVSNTKKDIVEGIDGIKLTDDSATKTSHEDHSIDDESEESAKESLSTSDGNGSVSEEETSDEGSQSETEEEQPIIPISLVNPALQPEFYARAPDAYDNLDESDQEPDFQIYGQNSLLAQRHFNELAKGDRHGDGMPGEYHSGSKGDGKRIELLGVVSQSAQAHVFQSNSLLSRTDMPHTGGLNSDGTPQQGYVRSTGIDGPLLGNVQGEANQHKPKLEGGLLGEMNRREKEREYLKRLGYYKATGPTGGVIPPSFYQSPMNMMGGMPGMGYSGMGMQGMGYPGMGMQGMGYPGMGMQGMGYPGMGMQGMGYPGMGMQGMGMPGMGYPGMMYGMHNPMMGFIPPDPTDDSPEDPVITQHREMVRQQWLELERSKERQRNVERSTETMQGAMGIIPGMGMNMGMQPSMHFPNSFNTQNQAGFNEQGYGIQPSSYKPFVQPSSDLESSDENVFDANRHKRDGHHASSQSSSDQSHDDQKIAKKNSSDTSDTEMSSKPSQSGTEDEDGSQSDHQRLASGTESDEDPSDESDEDVPLHVLAANKKIRTRPAPALRPTVLRGASSSESDASQVESDDDIPLMDVAALGKLGNSKRPSDASNRELNTHSEKGTISSQSMKLEDDKESDSSDEPLGARILPAQSHQQPLHSTISSASLGSHFHTGLYGTSGGFDSTMGAGRMMQYPQGIQFPPDMPITPQMQQQMMQLHQLQMQQMQLMQQMQIPMNMGNEGAGQPKWMSQGMPMHPTQQMQQMQYQMHMQGMQQPRFMGAPNPRQNPLPSHMPIYSQQQDPHPLQQHNAVSSNITSLPQPVIPPHKQHRTKQRQSLLSREPHVDTIPTSTKPVNPHPAPKSTNTTRAQSASKSDQGSMSDDSG